MNWALNSLEYPIIKVVPVWITSRTKIKSSRLFRYKPFRPWVVLFFCTCNFFWSICPFKNTAKLSNLFCERPARSEKHLWDLRPEISNPAESQTTRNRSANSWNKIQRCIRPKKTTFKFEHLRDLERKF